VNVRGVTTWLDAAAPPGPQLIGDARADVVIVGAGFTGLWTAIQLTERDPSLEVVVLEAETSGYGASGRNGGFIDPSLTHGLHNGLTHFPDEIDELDAPRATENYRRDDRLRARPRHRLLTCTASAGRSMWRPSRGR
jgi:glycine/D-amino acid oxidase-like deaminating enzyme